MTTEAQNLASRISALEAKTENLVRELRLCVASLQGLVEESDLAEIEGYLDQVSRYASVYNPVSATNLNPL